MSKFIILDDVFDTQANKAIADFDYDEGEHWYELGSNPVHEKILDLCRTHFDLDRVVGYEMWSNSSNPGWHVDKDERLYQEKKRYAFPQCSAVYYARVENLNGGVFLTDDIRLFPKTNRLIMFSPGMSHSVSVYTGTRIAVSMAPWNERVYPRGESVP